MSAHSDNQPHITPVSTYLGIGLALLFLTFVTVWIAQFDLGEFNLIVAMLVATLKGTLVALIFMHLYYDYKLYATIFVVSLGFLALFIVFTLFDTMRRGDIYPETGRQIKERSAIYDNLKPTQPAEGSESQH